MDMETILEEIWIVKYLFIVTAKYQYGQKNFKKITVCMLEQGKFKDNNSSKHKRTFTHVFIGTILENGFGII